MDFGTKVKRLFILTGEGIECEKEAKQFFSLPAFECEVSYAPVPKILRGEIQIEKEAQPGDFVYLPGGFSFSDHFGSGKLLAYKLNEKKFFEKILAAKLHIMGFCNGFQVLTETGLFGAGVRLEHNQNSMGFVNRWVTLKAAPDLFKSSTVQIPIRHGEGRLSREKAAWEPFVKPFIFYDDPRFDNGSIDRIAGLRAEIQSSYVWGMMPHPEIAARMNDRPDSIGPEKMGLSRSGYNPDKVPADEVGDGLQLVLEMFRMSAQKSSTKE